MGEERVAALQDGRSLTRLCACCFRSGFFCALGVNAYPLPVMLRGLISLANEFDNAGENGNENNGKDDE